MIPDYIRPSYELGNTLMAMFDVFYPLEWNVDQFLPKWSVFQCCYYSLYSCSTVCDSQSLHVRSNDSPLGSQENISATGYLSGSLASMTRSTYRSLPNRDFFRRVFNSASRLDHKGATEFLFILSEYDD